MKSVLIKIAIPGILMAGGGIWFSRLLSDQETPPDMAAVGPVFETSRTGQTTGTQPLLPRAAGNSVSFPRPHDNGSTPAQANGGGVPAPLVSEIVDIAGRSEKEPPNQPANEREARIQADVSEGEPGGISPTIQADGVPLREGRNPQPLPQSRIILPVALRDLPEDAAPLSPIQELAFDLVEEAFVQSIGGEDQPAGDPAYRQRWLRSQPIADQHLRALIGQEAFDALRMAAAKAAVQVKLESGDGANP